MYLNSLVVRLRRNCGCSQVRNPPKPVQWYICGTYGMYHWYVPCTISGMVYGIWYTTSKGLLGWCCPHNDSESLNELELNCSNVCLSKQKAG